MELFNHFQMKPKLSAKEQAKRDMKKSKVIPLFDMDISLPEDNIVSWFTNGNKKKGLSMI